MSATTELYTTNNYLVPASGNTHVVKFSGTATAAASLLFDFQSFSMQQSMTFVPQGVTIDNTAGTATATLTINPIGFVADVPAGSVQAVQFPAIANGQAIIAGVGQINAYFVDYPLLPQGTAATITGTANVNIESSSIAGGLPVAVPQQSSAGAYNVSNVPVDLINVNGTLAAGATSVTLTGAAAGNIRRVRVVIPSNATLATAGTTALTIEQPSGPTVIYAETLYIPATVGGTINGNYVIDLDMGSNAIANAAGTGDVAVEATLSTALATGTISINFWYD